jgi:hypothetical protein
MTIEFGLCAKKLSEQLKEFNISKEKTAEWQSIADFIITAHIHHAITDKQGEKLNILLGKKISRYLKGERNE